MKRNPVAMAFLLFLMMLFVPVMLLPLTMTHQETIAVGKAVCLC